MLHQVICRAVFWLGCLTACASTGAQDDKPARGSGVLELRGIVVDENGEPSADAKLSFVWHNTAAPPTTTTGRDGRFALDVPRNGLVEWFSSIPILATSHDGTRLGFLRLDGTNNPTEPLRMVVKPPHELVAHVVDEKNNPVTGARVEVSEQKTSLATGTTDAQGTCRLLIPAEARVFWVIALKDGVGFDYFENARTSPPVADELLTPPKEARLVLDGARDVRVRVTDGAGKPLPGVVVRPWSIKKPGKLDWFDFRWLQVGRASSDDEGFAQFRWYPAGKDQSLSTMFRSADSRYWARQRPGFNPEKPDEPLTLVVERHGMVTGRVLDSHRRPISGACLLADGHAQGYANAQYYATTRDDGTYLIDVPPTWHFLIATQDDTRATWSRSGVVVSEGGSMGNVDFELGEGTVVRGVVTDVNKGNPIMDAEVRMYEMGEHFSDDPMRPDYEHLTRTAKTDAEGRYAFRVGSGTYQIAGPGQPLFDNPEDESRLKIANEPLIERDFQVEQPPRPRVVSGRVIDGSGKAVADARVEGRSMDRHRDKTRFDALTDSDGRFRGGWGGDDAALVATNGDRSQSTVFRLAPQDSGNIILQLAPAHSARGRVLDRNGAPMPGMEVHCSWGFQPQRLGRDGPLYLNTKTDDQGRLELKGFPEGVHGLVYFLKMRKDMPGAAHFIEGPTFQIAAEGFDLGDITPRFPPDGDE